MMTYEETLKKLALADDRIVVMTAENRAPIRGLPSVLGDRFIDTGITEQAMIGAAAGLALRGRIPVAHALATFLTLRGFEFIRTDAGIGNLPVKLVGYVPGFLSDGNGPTHQAIEDVSLMRGIPNMQVFCPADHDDMALGLQALITSPAPCYLRYNPRPAVTAHTATALGKSESFGEGSDVAILTYGTLFTEAWEAKKILDSRGLSTRLVNLRWLKPLDEAVVLSSLKEARLTVTVEDHFLTGGLFSIVSELCLKNRLSPDVLAVALDNHWYRPGRFQEVLEHEGFTGPRIAEKILSKLQ